MVEIVIVKKSGDLESAKLSNPEDLYKKCGFKKPDDFQKYCDWVVKHDKQSYNIQVYGKMDGRANTENKYDFPPPIDNVLFFGSCAIVAFSDNEVVDLSLEMWDEIYEKLFGGFEDLAATALEDEMEEDELANVPKEMLTKEGYLKDGFVVDDDESDCDAELSEESYVTEDEDEDDE